MSETRRAFDYHHGWLPAVLPASVERFRVTDSRLRETLRRSGVVLVDDRAEVEIGRLRDLRDDSALVVALPTLRDGSSDSRFAERVAGRIARSALLRLWLARTSMVLRRRKLTTRRFYFDLEQQVSFDRVSTKRVAARFPRYGAVIASKTEFGQTLLEAVQADASRETGKTFSDRRPTLRAAGLVNFTDDAVLRIAIGDAQQLLHDQAQVLGALRERRPPADVAAAVPAILAEGSRGLATWSVESRLPGAPPPLVLPPAVLDDAFDFITRLHGVERGVVSEGVLAAAARAVRAAVGADAARVAETVARRADEVLAGSPAIFGHGDFFAGNLLMKDGRLSGVVDWEGGGPGRLPLLDLLHLMLQQEAQPTVYEWGPAVATSAMALAERRNGPIQDYLDKLELRYDEHERRALAGCYWLTIIGHQLGSYAPRAADARWVAQNVLLPSRVLA